MSMNRRNFLKTSLALSCAALFGVPQEQEEFIHVDGIGWDGVFQTGDKITIAGIDGVFEVTEVFTSKIKIRA